MKPADRTKTGIVFNIQKFSINDGPGIRTTVFLKGCPLHCRWCSNPESQAMAPQVLRDAKKCVGCHHCVEACPAHAVTLDANGALHFAPNSACADCGRCVRECPAQALEVAGERKTVQQVLDVVLQDRPFYEESGGGLTLSGGEFLLQHEFSLELLKAAKEEGLHTCCETTAFAAPDVFDAMLPYLDTLYIDMKHADADRHKKFTGVDNALCLENLAHAIAAGKDVLVRIPIIPGFNDSTDDAERMAAKLHEIGAPRCQLLPFHQFGENKYALLGRTYAYRDVDALTKDALADTVALFRVHGIDAFV